MKKLTYKIGQIGVIRFFNPVSILIGRTLGHYWTHAFLIVRVGKDYVDVEEGLGTYDDDKYKDKGLWAKWKFLTKIRKLFCGKVKINRYSKKQFDQYFNNNILKIMDFEIRNDSKFRNFVKKYENRPYDYFNSAFIGVSSIFKLFGKDVDIDLNSDEKVFCSELVLRAIGNLTDIDVLKVLNLNSYEDGTPQHISILYDKLKATKIL